MLLLAYSTATTRPNWMTPAFAAAYPTAGDPVQRMPEVEAMLTIEPPPLASITGITCLHMRNTLVRLMSICLRQSSSLSRTGPPRAGPPTLLTRMSMPP